MHQCLQRHLRALLEPLSSEVALEAENAFVETGESDVNTLEWIRRLVQQLRHLELQQLVTALQEKRGCQALTTADPISSGVAPGEQGVPLYFLVGLPYLRVSGSRATLVIFELGCWRGIS